MDNALNFISDYNKIDARLRSLYRGKGNLQFSDLVRRCAEFNRTVKKYEEELTSFARLRNAIVHGSTTERVIAEPCDEVTELIAHIARLLCAPPRLKELKEREISGISAGASLKEAVVMAAKTGYSNLPVYAKGRMIGILNNRRVVRALGAALQAEIPVEEVLQKPCSDILKEEDLQKYYFVLGKESTVEEAIEAFERNRKLLAVVVTEGGYWGDKIINLLTAADLPLLYDLLEN